MSDFDPETWLGVAEVCCITIPGIDEQALLRTALNRAYYAALLCVKQRIEAAQGPGAVPTTGAHAAILEAVRSGGSGFTDTHLSLRKLKRQRENADYLLRTPPLVRQIVHESVRQARTLIRNRIKALPEAEFRRLRVPRG
ncbi:MAG TPA: hypothetical protein VF771_06825 [Longimicrobiaceae bacterium]